MRHKRLSRTGLTLAALSSLTLLTACEARPISSDFWHDLQDYRSKPHYRAFVMTPGGPRSGRAMSMVWGRSSIDEAIKDSLYGCQGYDNRTICRLHYLGDIYVGEMTEEELARAKEIYESNPAATNEDL